MAEVLLDRRNHRVGPLAHPRMADAAIVVGASLLMAACAHISIPLWFTPVPITLQTFGVMCLALSLGGWRASAALLLYVLEGVCGLPVFSPHGPGGIAQLLGPTGGYLMAYPVAALCGGVLAEKVFKGSPLLRLSVGAVVCEFVVFAAGALWLLLLSHQAAGTILASAVLPFLPGEILKGIAAIAAALGTRRILS
jgi:biotin transport system substrate-specific component